MHAYFFYFKRACLVFLFLIFTNWHSSALAQQAEDLETLLAETNTMYQAGQSKSAWQLIKQYSDQYEGNAKYDYLYGLLANTQAQYPQAVMALERVLWQIPDQPRALLELGRAYFSLGKFQEASDVFLQVKAQAPPQQVLANIEAFLVAIEAQKNQRTTTHSFSAEAIVGHDTNINSSTSEDFITIFGLPLTLNETSQATDDDFFQSRLNYRMTQPKSKSRALHLEGSFTETNFFSTEAFDLWLGQAQVGWSWLQKSTQWRVNARYHRLHLDDSSFQWAAFLEGVWSYAWRDSVRQSMSLSVGVFEYPGMHERDTDFIGFNANWQWVNPKSVFGLGINMSYEQAQDSSREDLGRKVVGMNVSYQYQLTDKHSFYGFASLQQIVFNEEQPAFNLVRVGDTMVGVVGWRWQALKKIQLFVEGQYTEATNDIVLYEFDRTVGRVGVKTQW